jgi:hypothetical protein
VIRNAAVSAVRLTTSRLRQPRLAEAALARRPHRAPVGSTVLLTNATPSTKAPVGITTLAPRHRQRARSDSRADRRSSGPEAR